jgi:hypothetical protein
MTPYVSHSREEETPEAKARWFQSLSMNERAEVLFDFMDLALSINPRIADYKNAEQIRKGIRIITPP